jgi:tetratricopeptide (TPR) repeat protein
MEHWTNEEQYILKQFTVLPSLPIKAKQLLDWLQYEKRVYKNTLQNLARKGWLSTKDQQQYEMHRLLKVLIQKHLGVRWEDVKVMVESVKDELAEDKIIANPLASQWLIEYINSFLENINFQDNKVDEGYLWFRLGFIYYFMSFYDDAKQCYEKALNIVSTDKGTFNKEYAHILNELGIVLENERKYEEAIALHQKALQIRKEVLGEKHYDFATSLNNLATLYQKMGEYEKALPLYQEALQIYQAVLGRKHPIYAQSLNDLAILYNKQDKYQEALVLHMEAAHIRQEVLGRQHPDFAQSIQNLGVVYFQQGDYEQAKKYLAEAYYIYVEKLGTQHPHTQNTKEWLDKIDALPNPKLS